VMAGEHVIMREFGRGMVDRFESPMSRDRSTADISFALRRRLSPVRRSVIAHPPAPGVLRQTRRLPARPGRPEPRRHQAVLQFRPGRRERRLRPRLGEGAYDLDIGQGLLELWAELLRTRRHRFEVSLLNRIAGSRSAGDRDPAITHREGSLASHHGFTLYVHSKLAGKPHFSPLPLACLAGP